jgi:hypothetical protein
MRLGPTRLLMLYPAAWRRRYGDELDALIIEMRADGRAGNWRLSTDLVRSAARERLRGTHLGPPAPRIGSGATLVLWAWALFVLAGAVVAKTSEHWRQALPPHAGSGASAAFWGLTVVAVLAAALIAAGIALTLPAAARFLGNGGWRRIRARTRLAAALTGTAILATAALVTWAQRLSAADRAGHDHLYAAAFLGWAALGAAALLAWTAVAARIARTVRCSDAVLRAQALIAPAVALALGVMTVATVAWWVLVARVRPGALTGGSVAVHPSALVAPLVAAVATMIVATGIAVIGAVRADVALGEL